MLLAFSMGKEFSPPSPVAKSNDWSNAVSFPAAWFSSWRPPSAPSKAACAKFALLAARRPMPCCWLLTGQEFPLTTESPRFPEHASFANPYPLRKRLFRRHDASFVSKEVSGPFREQAQTGAGENYQAGLAFAGCRTISSAHLQAPSRGYDPRPRRLCFRFHRQKVSRFSWWHCRERSRARASAHRESHPPRSRPRHSSLESLSQYLPRPARAQTRRMVWHGSRLFFQQRHGSHRWRNEAGAPLWTPVQ